VTYYIPKSDKEWKRHKLNIEAYILLLSSSIHMNKLSYLFYQKIDSVSCEGKQSLKIDNG